MCDDETTSLAKPLQLGGFDLDVPAEIERIVSFLNESVFQRFKKRGAVVGISGGIDSSVVLALCESLWCREGCRDYAAGGGV